MENREGSTKQVGDWIITLSDVSDKVILTHAKKDVGALVSRDTSLAPSRALSFQAIPGLRKARNVEQEVLEWVKVWLYPTRTEVREGVCYTYSYHGDLLEETLTVGGLIRALLVLPQRDWDKPVYHDREKSDMIREIVDHGEWVEV